MFTIVTNKINKRIIIIQREARSRKLTFNTHPRDRVDFSRTSAIFQSTAASSKPIVARTNFITVGAHKVRLGPFHLENGARTRPVSYHHPAKNPTTQIRPPRRSFIVTIHLYPIKTPHLSRSNYRSTFLLPQKVANSIIMNSRSGGRKVRVDVTT